jgi:small-conductance mechanosensitive channel
MNNILALIAFATFLVFLGILLWNVPRLDLICVVGVTVALAGWDLLQNLRGNRG